LVPKQSSGGWIESLFLLILGSLQLQEYHQYTTFNIHFCWWFKPNIQIGNRWSISEVTQATRKCILNAVPAVFIPYNAQTTIQTQDQALSIFSLCRALTSLYFEYQMKTFKAPINNPRPIDLQLTTLAYVNAAGGSVA
jgi:hypothetical protein